ncbi:heterokaryon incompatibility protein-domain-containing protein [Xylaria palmicola]|nr:heterokaryon incompatibility protein-domain-containing protein [Xylaria palmicola]
MPRGAFPPGTVPTGASLAGDKSSWPITLSLLEQNRLTVTIYHHEMQSMVSGLFWCWTYITSGLRALGQKEMIFTLKRRMATEREEDFQTDMLEWFSNIYMLAQSEMLVDEWDQSRFYRKGFLGRDDIRLVLYSPPLDIRALPPGAMPEERLHIIPATAPEADVVHYYGVMRFISQLGKSERWFPVHPWFDRDRQPCVTTAQMTGTIRSMFSFTSVGGVSAMKRGSDLVMYVPHKSAHNLKSAIPAQDASIVFGLDSYPYNGSDSGMTWTNQDTVYRAYGIGSTCMSLGFLVFCPDQDQDECMMEEDGYILLVKRSTWIGIMNSINLSRPMQLVIGDLRFCLEYGAPEAKVAPPVVPPSAREPHRDPALAALPQPQSQLPATECIFAKESGDRDFWSAQKHDPSHRTDGGQGTGEYPVVLTLGDLEADEQRSCDKCVVLARGIRSYVSSGDKSLRLQFFHRGTKLCCAVEADSGYALILDTTSEDYPACPWLLHPMAVLASNRLVSDRSADQALKWYTNCRDRHGSCKPVQPTKFPARVLDLGIADEHPDMAYLLETPSGRGQFGTLSHCWPSGETITTTLATLESGKGGIALPDLPRSFQNAVLLFRKLGIRYMWVDSLCIIQDDEADWQAQAAQIDSIFTNSSVTIAVADDGGCTPGCFLSEPPDLPSRMVRWPGVDGEGSYLTTVGHSSEHTPLLRTGAGSDWVHPERRGTKRILYVGKTELLWECKMCSMCECGYQDRAAGFEPRSGLKMHCR